jgi:glycosyltransferase involved in cell wall biosynthesis
MAHGGGGVNVGFVSTRLAGTDGVSLETAKIAELLARMGHDVAYCAGELDFDGPNGRLVREMHFRHPEILAIQNAVFGGGEVSQLRKRIDGSVGRLRNAIRAFVDDFSIDVLMPQNALAIPVNVPLGVALGEDIAASGISTVAHHHDFSWERERFATCAVQDLLDAYFPPVDLTIRHIAISSIAARELRVRRGVDAVVIPNIMDFASGPPERVSRSVELRAALGFGEDDIVLLQSTRVVPRKGIEHTIELARRIAERIRPRPVRILISHHVGDEGTAYYADLRCIAKRAGVELTLACDRFVDCRDGVSDDEGIYDLRDAYECADLVTYPSLIEGFGNALLEAVFFRRPLLVNRYPVFVADIEPCGFDFIEIDGRIDDRAVDAVLLLLASPERTREVAEQNYDIARHHFSYEAAQERLEALLENIV